MTEEMSGAGEEMLTGRLEYEQEAQNDKHPVTKAKVRRTKPRGARGLCDTWARSNVPSLQAIHMEVFSGG